MPSRGSMANKVRLYDIYNMTVNKSGEPFAMCDSCYRRWRSEGYPKGSDVIVSKLANNAVDPCNHCRMEAK